MKKIISACKKSFSLLALLTIFFNQAKSQVIVEAEGGAHRPVLQFKNSN